MTKVEDMMFHRQNGNDLAHCLCQTGFIRDERQWIEITLYGRDLCQDIASPLQRHARLQADCIGSGALGNLGMTSTYSARKDDDGHLRAPLRELPSDTRNGRDDAAFHEMRRQVA